MARFLTTKQCLAEIEEVIHRAERELLLVSPYVQVSGILARRLRDADERGVRIALVCRAGDLKPDQRELLAGLPNLRVHDDPKLHAKAFANERGVVLTSLNLYEASEQNNEMGVYLSASEDGAAYRDAVQEARSIIAHAAQAPLGRPAAPARPPKANATAPAGADAAAPGERKGGLAAAAKALFGSKGEGAPKAGASQEAGPRPKAGHCLRCGTEVPYDPSKPYCPRCFKSWARFGDPTYGDDHCHSCGKEERKAFSLEKPECLPCYRTNAKAAAV